MAITYYVEVEVQTSRRPSGMSKALKELQELDRDFPSTLPGWWRNPPDNPRGFVARCLSRHGLTGRLSVAPWAEWSAWDEPPKPRWTGFNARSER